MVKGYRYDVVDIYTKECNEAKFNAKHWTKWNEQGTT